MAIPPELVEVLRRREAVLVAGAGCSVLAGTPGWKEIIAQLAARLPHVKDRRQTMALAGSGRSGAALALLTQRLGGQVADQIVAELNAGERELPPVLAALAAAPWRAVVTTGFDATWLRAHAAAGAEPLVLTAGTPVADDAVVLDDDVRLLIQVLGQAAEPDTLCLGAADLRRRVVDTGLGDVLAALARRYSFVFVGFDPGDPDLEWVAGRLIGATGGDHRHFVLCPGASRLDLSVLGAGTGLEPIETEAPLAEALAALAAAATPRPRARERLTAEARAKRPPAPRMAAATRSTDTFEPLAAFDRDPEAQAMYLYAAALLHRGRRGDRATATGLLDRALELDPALGAAWEALARLVDSELGDDGRGSHAPSELTDEEQMLWATRVIAGARRGQA
jgi:SIR2-like domain